MPLKDKTADSLIEAIENTIVRLFGPPKFLRSDQESGLAATPKFYQYLQTMKTKYFPTSVASPWGNGHAERSIRTI